MKFGTLEIEESALWLIMFILTMWLIVFVVLTVRLTEIFFGPCGY